jgi:serine/threonine protein kinase
MIRKHKIGDGAYGIVYSCNPTMDPDRTFAVKRNLMEISDKERNDKERSDKKCNLAETDIEHIELEEDIFRTVYGTDFIGVIREADMLCKLRHHPYIVQLQAVAFSEAFTTTCFSPLLGEEHEDHENQKDDKIHFVFEQSDQTLDSFIKYDDKPNYYGRAKLYMLQMLLALEYMHSKKIIHRDIKPGNILLFERPDLFNHDSHISICDMGIAKPYTHQGTQTPGTMTTWFRPPEVALHYPFYDYKADVWALACTFFEMIARKPLIPDKANKKNIISYILAILPEELPADKYQELISRSSWTQARSKDNPHPSRPRPRINKNVANAPKLSWKNRIGLTKDGLNAFKSEAGDLNQFCNLLNHMLTFEWRDLQGEKTRYTITQCLNHPFFKQERDLIDRMRELYPIENKIKPIRVIDCMERRWMGVAAIELFNVRETKSWYHDRLLFQAIHIFDRYLVAMFSQIKPKESGQTLLSDVEQVETEEQGLIHTREETELRFWTCIYLCHKYFLSMSYSVMWEVMVPEEFHTEECKSMAGQFEASLIKNCLQYNVYHDTLFEAADDFGDLLDEEEIRDLLTLYCTNTSMDGLEAQQVYAYYRKYLHNKSTDDLIEADLSSVERLHHKQPPVEFSWDSLVPKV